MNIFSKNDIKVDDFNFIMDDKKENEISIITIYDDKTSDYPGLYIARLFKVKAGTIKATNFINSHENLNKLRKSIPYNLTCFNRNEFDDIHIIESWL